MVRDGRARRRAKKVKPGDGSRLKPYKWWHPLYRSLYSVTLTDVEGVPHLFEVDINFYDLGARAYLYRDKRQLAVSKLQAAFPVDGGRIEVVNSLFGLKRMHLVSDRGEATMLSPHPLSSEGRRAALERKRPGLSRTLGALAIVVLIVALAVGLLETAELVSQWDLLADHLGTFTSPFDIPDWLYASIGIATVAAVVERSLTMRHHWLLDSDSGFMFD